LTAGLNGPLTTSDKVLGAHDAPADIANRKMNGHIDEDDRRRSMKLRMIVNAAGELVPSLVVEMSRVYNATVSSLKPTLNKYCGRLSFATTFPDPPHPFINLLHSPIAHHQVLPFYGMTECMPIMSPLSSTYYHLDNKLVTSGVAAVRSLV
jgi:hypothetical protein